MKSLLHRFWLFLIVGVLCTVFVPQSAEAQPHILYHVQHVNMYNAGEVEVVGYFENDGDDSAYVKWTEFDLTLTADNDQQMWADYGIRHYLDLLVPAYDSVDYTFYIQNEDIPEYHGHYRWRTSNARTHWSYGAG